MRPSLFSALIIAQKAPFVNSFVLTKGVSYAILYMQVRGKAFALSERCSGGGEAMALLMALISAAIAAKIVCDFLRDLSNEVSRYDERRELK